MLTFFQFMCTIEDLKEMGIPLGPRKKIAKFVKERVNKQVCFSHKCVVRPANVSVDNDKDGQIFFCSRRQHKSRKQK